MTYVGQPGSERRPGFPRQKANGFCHWILDYYKLKQFIKYLWDVITHLWDEFASYLCRVYTPTVHKHPPHMDLENCCHVPVVEVSYIWKGIQLYYNDQLGGRSPKGSDAIGDWGSTFENPFYQRGSQRTHTLQQRLQQKCGDERWYQDIYRIFPFTWFFARPAGWRDWNNPQNE